MLEAIGAILPFGIGVALSPVPIIAVILMLVSAKARVNGPMFIVGWMVGLAVVGVIVLAIAGPAGASDEGEPADWVAIVEIVLGALLLLLAVKQWRGRPRDGERRLPVPGWPQPADVGESERADVRGRGHQQWVPPELELRQQQPVFVGR